jgi:UTP-glucose-1-phosphate uridylyltransferase
MQILTVNSSTGEVFVVNDCGSKLGDIKANIEYGLRNPELGDDFRVYLPELMG